MGGGGKVLSLHLVHMPGQVVQLGMQRCLMRLVLLLLALRRFATPCCQTLDLLQSNGHRPSGRQKSGHGQMLCTTCDVSAGGAWWRPYQQLGAAAVCCAESCILLAAVAPELDNACLMAQQLLLQLVHY